MHAWCIGGACFRRDGSTHRAACECVMPRNRKVPRRRKRDEGEPQTGSSTWISLPAVSSFVFSL